MPTNDNTVVPETPKGETYADNTDDSNMELLQKKTDVITVPTEAPSKSVPADLKEKLSSNKKTLIAIGISLIVVCLLLTLVICLLYWQYSAVTEKEDYNATKADTQVIACPPGVEPNATQVCILQKVILGHECIPEMVWNYNTTSPCIILSYNGKTKFDPYDDIEKLPSQMPNTLRDLIRSITYENGGVMKEVIWVSCTHFGIHSYYGPGFPSSFFSNTNLPGYRKPIVAFQLVLKDLVNTTVEIDCNMWAKGIDEQSPEASVKFTVTLEKN
ncbi:Sodium/potassium-transporting ATPase subunit beta-1-like [Homarus americanus]|uniref:Sodium/potassium-transporting ATPase subunit beta-1-like n=1 Tax=Homarus americanus TaxID=6706 RepID=A0A8J5JPW8_HOMAM|nr:Sodium/potassium-transporting ATPase subunit beta-1-like [Homarus americanus]